MRPSLLVLGALGVMLTGAEAHSQRPREAPRTARAFQFGFDDDRAMLGISTSSSGERDTLGLLITSVAPDGPADKAGLEEGNRIAAINNVDLRLAAADAGEPDMNGMVSRRLSRELSKLDAGQEVELRVWADGRYKTVKVKTVAADELPGRRRVSRTEREERAVIGVNLSASGTLRDTLGVLIVRVAPKSPAERAGLVEGNRIAAIGDVDLRVARADAEDRVSASAKANRFTREMAQRKAGDEIQLRVWSDGQFKTVRLKTAKAEEVYEDGSWSFITSDGAGTMLGVPMPPMPPMERLRIPPAPHAPGEFLREWHWQSDEAPVRAPPARISSALGQPADDAILAPAVAFASAPAVAAQARVVLPPDGDYEQRLGFEGGVVSATADGARYTLDLPGLRLAKVNDELAAYFGAGSERGLLVLDAVAPWTALRAGDVILDINGAPVRRGDRASVSLDLGRQNIISILRNKARRTITLH